MQLTIKLLHRSLIVTLFIAALSLTYSALVLKLSQPHRLSSELVICPELQIDPARSTTSAQLTEQFSKTPGWPWSFIPADTGRGFDTSCSQTTHHFASAALFKDLFVWALLASLLVLLREAHRPFRRTKK